MKIMELFFELTHVSNGKFYLQLGLDGRKVRAAQMFDGGRTGDVA